MVNEEKNSIFNEKMSSNEARYSFFKAVEGKSKDEIEIIKLEYEKVLEIIYDREMKLSEEGWLL